MVMIIFQNIKYQLFFSNKLPPLIALNYADELFFNEFNRLVGKRYRILSVIRNGWQRKHGRIDDIEKLKKQFENKIDNLEWADYLFDFYEKKSKELRNFLDEIKEKEYSKLDDNTLVDDIKEVRRKSSMLDAMTNMFHLFSSLMGSEFYQNLKNYSKDSDLINENLIFYTQPIKESKHAKIKMNELPNKFELSPRDSNFSKLLRIGAFVNDDVSALLHLRKEVMHDLFVEIAERINCTVDDLDYLQISEIENFLLTKNNINSLIEKRRRLTILIYPEENLNIYEGDEAEEFLKEGGFNEVIQETEAKVLEGQTASLGKASGKVIVAMNSNEAARKMVRGAILVAPYTAVEYIPAIQKAAAIITETGGITSHAAIVSREFGIPCIVGVQDVTKLLKDGQKVEVDADQGTIRIIEYHNK